MAYEVMDPDAIRKALFELPGWTMDAEGLAIARTFKFSNFRAAFAFMSECALIAEKLNHHPEWSNVNGQVDVRLTTHSAKGVTGLDLQLAAAMDKAAMHRH